MNSQIMWPKQLQPQEWPAGSVDLMSPLLLQTVVNFRVLTGIPLVPSPLFEAHVRTQGSTTSQHYVGPDLSDPIRLATGTDLFIPNARVFEFFREATWIKAFGGIGIYFDTQLDGKPRVMVHVDIRTGERILWVTTKGDNGKREYHYYHKDPGKYLEILKEMGEKFRDS